MPTSVAAWSTWFQAWYASHWGPGDLPGLRVLVLLFDQVKRGEFQRAGEMRMWMDGYGVAPTGQQARRWSPPEEEVANALATSAKPAEFAHLHVVEPTEPA